MAAPKPTDMIAHVDRRGHLTIDAMKMFQIWVMLLDALDAEREAHATTIANHAATLADHEARITTLEP